MKEGMEWVRVGMIDMWVGMEWVMMNMWVGME